MFNLYAAQNLLQWLVLGVPASGYNSDLNTLITENKVYYASTTDASDKHYPSGESGGLLIVHRSAITGTISFVWQALHTTGNKIYARFGRIENSEGQWSAWKEL